MKTLVVVSGGDAPGINMTLGGLTGLAEAKGDTMAGATGGFAGLFLGQIVPLTSAVLVPWVVQPGSFLPSSRDPVLNSSDARATLLSVLSAQQVDNVVLVGGNGTIRFVLPLLRDWGIPCIALPATIDNDVPGTERTLGFDSACNFAYQAIDGIVATAHALPGRLFVVETLGGETGYLALEIAYGARADIVLVPEYNFSMDWLYDRLKKVVQRQGYALLVFSEGVKNNRTLADQIAQHTPYRVRDVRLGHAQRGGKPSHLDRILAMQMARVAYGALCQGVSLGVVVVRGGRTVLELGVLEGLPTSPPDRSIYETINDLNPDHDSAGN